MAKKGFIVYGTDISEPGLKEVKQKKRELGLSNIHLKKEDMSKITFKKGFFDAIVATSVINHSKIKKIKKTFKEITRVLKKKGIFILKVLSLKDFASRTGKEVEHSTRIGIDDWDSDLPHHFFTKPELKMLLKDFSIIDWKNTKEISERP